MNRSSISLLCVFVLSSCVYSPPKGIPTVPFTLRALSASGTAKVCSEGSWVPLGTLAVTPAEHKNELIKWDGEEFSNNLPAGTQVLLKFTAFGGPAGYGEENFCDVVVMLPTQDGNAYRADLKNLGYACQVKIFAIDNAGIERPVRDMIQEEGGKCLPPKAINGDVAN